uniref:Acid-sensing ion channel 1 n=1 Tax=Steinernema glaseri TaxID=37863 RepID=A0A1I8ATL6_9BILA
MTAIPEIVIEDEGPGTTPGDSPPVSNSKNHLSAQARGPRGSFSEEARRLTMKASELIIHVPVEHIKKIGETESMNSISRETEHFVGITTVHGPLRVYRGKGYYRYLWALALGCCVGLFLYQFTLLFQNFSGKPTVSQVSFILPEEGLPFPAVTICNYNPVRKSYVEALRNATDFSEVLLDYLIQAYMDVQILVEGATLSQLQEGESALQAYKQRDPNFTINAFFQDAGLFCYQVFVEKCSRKE